MPAEQLPGKRVHARRGLPGPDRPEDGDSGIEAAFRDHEPVRVGHLPRLDRVMRLPDDNGRVLVRCGHRPRRQPALALFLRWSRLEPDPPYAGKERHADHHHDTGHGGIPAMREPEKHGRIEGHQRHDRVLRSGRKWTGNIARDRGVKRHEEEENMTPFHARSASGIRAFPQGLL